MEMVSRGLVLSFSFRRERGREKERGREGRKGRKEKQGNKEKERENEGEEKRERGRQGGRRAPGGGETGLPPRDGRALSAAAAGSELLRVSNPGRLSDITPFLVG